jgi:hypothetical protein
MARLTVEAVLEVRLDEQHAVDTHKPRLVEDFICAFCSNFPVNPVMCDHC